MALEQGKKGGRKKKKYVEEKLLSIFPAFAVIPFHTTNTFLYTASLVAVSARGRSQITFMPF